MDVIVYAHTHWDREWYRPFQEFRLRLIDVIDQIIKEISEGRLECFFLDGQTIVLEDYLEVHPYKKQEIIQLIKNKKLQIGPWYVLADEFLVSGESLIRNLLIGINQAKEFACTSFVGYMPDSFGHNSEIPRILASFGINDAVIWRGAGDNKSEFIWKSEDGSSVFTVYLIEGYFQDILNQSWSIGEKTQKVGNLLNKIKKYATSNVILLPAGGDHLGPALDLDNQIKEINRHINGYTLCPGCISNYINLVKNADKQKDLNFKEIKGELRDNSRSPILPGTFSSRLYLKKENARATWKLNRLAEPLLAHFEQAGIVPDRKKELEYAWKLLLQNHPHDSICGCSVDEVHEEMMTRFKQVDQISEGLIARCFHSLAHRALRGDIIVYNASDYIFNGVSKIKTTESLPQGLNAQYLGSTHEFPQEILFDIQRIPVQEDIKKHHEYLVWLEDIPAHSISILDKEFRYKKPFDKVETSIDHIRNSKVELKVNDSGELTLLDHECGKTFDNLHIFSDLGDRGDSYNYSPVPNDVPQKALLARKEIVESGPLRGVLRLFYEMEIPESLDKQENHRSLVFLTQLMIVDIILYADTRRVEFKTMWENNCRDHILQLKFKFDEKIYRTVSENNFGMIERTFYPDYSLRENIPAAKNQELKTNTAPMQRFVWTNGLGIITEGMTEYGIDGDELYITLLRSVGKLSRGAIDTRGVPAGPPLDVPGAQCLGVQRAHYALYPTSTPEGLFKQADQFMGCILTESGVAQKNSKGKQIPHNLLRINDESIYTYAIKPAQDKKGMVARLMNISKEEKIIRIESEHNFTKITEVNSLENPISNEISIGQEIKFKPYELKSLLLE